MRTTLKNIDHFKRFKSEMEETIKLSNDLLRSGSVAKERIPYVKNGLRSTYLQLAIADYTSGLNPDSMKGNLEISIKYMTESWSGNWIFRDINGQAYPFYAYSFYMEFIWTLSLAILLKLDLEYLNQLDKLIIEDKIQDQTINFILNQTIPSRALKVNEQFGKYDFIPKKFKNLRLAIECNDEKQTINYLQEYLKKWYINLNGTGWYGSHKKARSYFFGYWSLETAVVTVILGANYNELISSKYFPKDLVVHYYNLSNHKN